MERFSERGNELLGTRQQKSFENPQSTRYSNSEMDFDDVFGGPPRRYSMQEVKMRYSFCESPEEESSEGNIEGNSTLSEPWSGIVEKPVFGEESVNRRRGVNDGFFDDIFKGDENYGSPRRSGNHGSNSGSRISSPVRPSPPPSSELFSTSLPSQFSLLPELTKVSDSHGLASDNDITTKNEDAKLNMSSNPVVAKSSFSKFLKRSMRGKHEPKGDQYRQSPLSREASVGNLESLDGLKKDIKTGKKSEDVESLVDGSEFHFSIHKWVHGEVPVIIRLREGKTIKVEAMSDQSAFEIKKDEEVGKEVDLDISDLKIDNVVPEGRKGAKSANFSNEEKKIDAKKKSLKKTPDSPKTSGNTPQKSGVKGKVRDFVKIFSQENTERSKPSNQSQSSRWTGRENYGMDGKLKFANKATENVEISKPDGTPNALPKEDEIPEKEEVKPKVSNPGGRRYTEQKEAPTFTDASSETDFRGSFSVEEISNNQDKDLQPSVDPDYIKVSDAKIKQWSQGRKGNIRSLLSTLQLVLWAESGWKPVPLMNIIEGSGVKRAYQRALLCLHPDKLQQKGAAPHQKYIAEKVFDILQEAWDHFNSLGDI